MSESEVGLSVEERTALRALAEAATPGPWDVERGGELNEPFWQISPVLRDRYGTNVISSSDEATIRFIAASRSAVPSLLGVVERLEAQLVEHRQAMWDGYRTLGFDTDGDETPASVTDLPDVLRLSCAEQRRDYDESMAETAAAEAELVRVRDQLAEV